MTGTAPAPRSDLTRAALWMIGAIFAFTLMAVAGRALIPTLDTFEVMFWRSLVGIAIVAGALTLTGGWGGVAASLSPRHLRLHGARNVFHFAGQNLWFHAITTAPLAAVFALEFTSPIWALLLAPLVLGEKLTRPRLMVAAAGFVGVLLVARPGGEMAPGLPFAALAALCFGVTALLTRKLTRDQSLGAILLWLTLMQAGFGALAAGWDGDLTAPPPALIGWTVTVGICGLVAHYSLTSALKLAPAAVVMPIDFARLPVITIVGAVLYAETLSPWVAAGAVIIIGANWAGLRAESQRAAAAR